MIIRALQLLKKADKPMSKMDFINEGLLLTRRDFKLLLKLGIVVRHENYAGNSFKTYYDKDGKGHLSKGTMYYTYEIVK